MYTLFNREIKQTSLVITSYFHFLRLHEREQPASGLLRVHVEFLVRRGVAFSGRLGATTGFADFAGSSYLQLRRDAAAAAMRVSATAEAAAAEVAVVTRASRRRGQSA